MNCPDCKTIIMNDDETYCDDVNCGWGWTAEMFAKHIEWVKENGLEDWEEECRLDALA